MMQPHLACSCPHPAAGARGEAGAGAAAARHQVSLESLAFRQGGHLMSNKSVALPQVRSQPCGEWADPVNGQKHVDGSAFGG